MAEQAERYALGQHLHDQLGFEKHLLYCKECQDVAERTWHDKVLPKLTLFLQQPQSTEYPHELRDDGTTETSFLL